MSSKPTTRLGSIFQDASAASSSDQGNASLRYVPPKEPTRSQTSAAATAPVAAVATATPEKASSIVYTATVSLYQYDSAARSYVQILNANSSATIGCVIVGSDASYNLLFYNAAKQHVCLLPLKFATFKPVLQPKNYVSFYDDKGVNWSVKFASEQQVSDFMRQIFLTKIHVEIWGDDKSVTKTAPNALIKDDLAFVKDDVSAVSAGDAVAVAFSCWRVVGNVTCAPNDVVTKYAPFEKASEAELRKFRLGDGSERIKALDEGVVGMKKGGKRIVLAPPGKTNGQDWYLLEVHLVKVKIGGGATQRKSGVAQSTASAAPSAAPDTTAAAPSGSNGKAAKTPRRRSSPAPGVDTSATGDIVPWGSESAQEELKLKDQQMRVLQEQLEALKMSSSLGLNAGFAGLQQQQQHAFTPQSAFSQASMFGGGAGSLFAPPQQQHPLMSMSGRPLDTLLSELHAKVDYLIRIAPAPTAGSSGGAVGGATDVSAVIRGVERLASENDRLMVQINAQNQQYVSYEKRCEELLKQSQQLQDEKRRAEEKYQAIASQQLGYSSELASLTSARDAAITQTNRLHAEYQQLLTAFYQKQQVSSVSEEQLNELNFERESRVRAERELKKESQTRALAEQELQLAKKQFDVTLKLKDSELATQKQALETQWLAAKSQELKDRDERLRHATLEFQQQTARQQEDFRQQLERKDAQLKAVQLEAQTLSSDKAQLTAQLTSASNRVAELERELEATAASAAAAASGAEANDDESAAIRLADEEKQIYAQQIALLQQQVKDLEAQQFQRVQDELASGRLASPTASPRSVRAKSFGECERCASADAKEQAAERALALAQSLKLEAEAMLAAGGGSTTDAQAAAAADREKLTTLFKEAVNEMFFRFQDFFEEEAAVESKHVLAVIRKVLKQSTKDVIQRLQAPPAALDGNGDGGMRDDDSDGPPAPPPLEPATTPAPAAATESAAPTASEGGKHDDDDDGKRAVSGTSSRRASSSVDNAVDAADPGSLFMESVSARLQVPGAAVAGYVSTDDEFED